MDIVEGVIFGNLLDGLNVLIDEYPNALASRRGGDMVLLRPHA